MNRKWNKLLCTTLVSVLLLKNIQVYANVVKMRLLYDEKMHNYEAESINITINGTILPPEDMPPIVLYDRTLVPARAVFEALGAEVAWNELSQEVYVRKQNDIIVLKADQNTATKNGTTFTMDVPAKVVNERTMIPVRAVSEALGCTVTWNENTRVVAIDEIIEPQESDEIIDENQNDNENSDGENDDNEHDSKYDNEHDDNKITEVNKKEYASGGTGNIPKRNIGVTHINIPENKNDKQIFSIAASNEIAKFQQIESDNDEIVIDIYYAQKEILTDDIEVETSDIVNNIVSLQYDEHDITITRIIFKLKEQYQYDIELNDDENGIIVYFGKKENNNNTNNNNNINNNNTNNDNINNSTNNSANTNITTNTNQTNKVKNVYYESARKAIALSKMELFAADNVAYIDDYINKKYQVILPGDYSNIYGSGTMTLHTDELVSVTVSQEEGKTAFTFEQNGINAFTVTEDANYYYINVKNPKEVYDKIVVLDAGHGGSDPGTSGNGLKEKDITIAIVQKLYQKLQSTTKVKTYVTRIGDTYPANVERATMANDIGDVFISIHMNSANPNPTPNGTEVLFITHETDVAGKLTSKDVATILLKNVVNALGTNNRGLKYDTPEQKNLIVLNRTVVPAVIVETLFLSNPGDALKISNELYQEKAAQAIYDSIMEIADNYNWR
ncbi:N-acetylmuramoyl-L-alanine amidase [Lachnospiraceae bacterium 46-61]